MKNQLKYSTALLLGMAGTTVALAQVTTPPPAEPPPAPKWEKSAALGFSYVNGTTDSLLFTADVNANYKAPRYEWLLGASGGYGESDDVVNNEFARAFAQYNYKFSDRFYAYGRADGLYDGIAGIDYRFVLSPGLGYFVVKTDRLSLALEAGPGVVFEQKKGEDSEIYATLRLADRFEYKISETTRLWQSFTYLPQIDDWGNYQFTAEVGIEAAISKGFALRLVGQNMYISQPAVGSEKNELRIVSSLAYKW